MTLRAPLSLLEEGRVGGTAWGERAALAPRAPAAMLVNISFVLILMELQRCMNVPLKTSPLILGRNNNVMGNTGTHSTVWQYKVGLLQNSLL